MNVLNCKKIVVMGVANNKSIAWGCAQKLKDEGADIIYTYQNERMKKSLTKLVGDDAYLVECDVSEDSSIDQAFSTIKNTYGNIDGIVHAIAYADKADLSGSILDISREGYNLSLDISAYSLISVARAAKPILNENSGIVTLTYIGSERVVPNYNLMGIAKASLESTVRYLATDLAPQNIRVNAISAGVIKTLALTGINDHKELLDKSNEKVPDKKGVTTEEVGNVCSFLMSPLSSGIIGEVIFVDKGVHMS